MIKSPRLNSVLLLFSLTLFGCASFEPGIQYRDLSRNRVPTAAESQKGLDVSFEEFVSAKKSFLAFDADIAGNGIMALLINLENKGDNVYRIPRSQLNASFDGEPLERLDGKQAAAQGASKDYASRALGWTMATGPFALLLAPLTLTGSSAHTAEVNRTIEAHFAALELPDALLKKNQTISGFVYFKLPFGLTNLENTMLEIAPIDDQTDDKLIFKFSLPAIGIELPPSRRERKTIEN